VVETEATTGEIVSTTIRSVIVALPVFVTTIWYVTDDPIPGFAGIWFFTTEMPTAYADASKFVLFVSRFVALKQAVLATIYAVLLSSVDTLTHPTVPVIVNV